MPYVDIELLTFTLQFSNLVPMQSMYDLPGFFLNLKTNNQKFVSYG